MFVATNNATATSDQRLQAFATQVDTAPVIDGIIDESVWSQAETLTNFTQSEPLEGQPATEKTEVRILFDETALYVGVICYDSSPSSIVVTDSRRDSNLLDMDSFQMIFDTYQDRQNGFVFGTNPAGMEYDGQVSKAGGGGQSSSQRSQAGVGNGFNLNWDASFTVRTRINEVGWTAEFKIPLRTLRYSSRKPQSWGLNFKRNIRRKREEVYWSPVSRIQNFYRLSSAGDLNGLNLEAPRNFKVTPFVLSSGHKEFTKKSSTDLNAQIGVDAKFGVTAALNIDVTVNTDFAQVEVDDQQINLTRFNLFFPEKRPFFLENAGTFSMGTGESRGRTLELFFSRRIGIGPSGELVPIRAGGRLSGKIGSYNIGLMNMQTEDLGSTLPANNFTVAALRRELPNRSSLGALFVNRAATGDMSSSGNWNRTWGLDGTLGIREAWTFRGMAARTETPNSSGRDHALDFYGEFRKLWGRFWVEYTEVGDAFNPEAGFLSRKDYRTIQSSYIHHIRVPTVSWLREVRPHATYRNFWDFNGYKQTEWLHLDSHVDFESGAFFSPAFNLRYEGLSEPFEITPGIIIPAGVYEFNEIAWRWNTNQSAPFSYSGGLNAGGFFSGDRISVESGFHFRHGAELNTAISWSHNKVNLPEGNFVANLGRAHLSYSFTPFINLQSVLQYNDQSDIWSANIRFSWLNTAGTGLFIVYNDTEGLGDFRIGPQNRSLIIKYTHQFDVLR